MNELHAWLSQQHHGLRTFKIFQQKLSFSSAPTENKAALKSRAMPETTTKFHCLNERAEYLVARVEGPPTHDELPLLCLGCDGPLRNREGKFALKYFRIDDGSGAHSLNGRGPKLG